VNHAENFKIKHFISRTAAFLIYFSASGFAGAICRVIFDSFMQIALKANPELKDIILYIISAVTIFIFMCVFSLREGVADTQDLRFSILKTLLSYISAGIIFFTIIICADIYIFGQDSFFKEYFFSPYYADEHIRNFTQSYSNNYFMCAAFIILNIIIMMLAYKAGREIWIARKKKMVQEMRENKLT
jgi:type IV secretory pathway TraG/TraD family ATPase VirD4